MTQTIGTRIREERERYGMSQAELARRIDISKTAMNDIERGKTKDPAYSIVKRIAQALRVRLDDLDPEEPAHA